MGSSESKESENPIVSQAIHCVPVKKLVFKILLVGNAGVGKSSLLTRFVDGIYKDFYISTIGVDFKIKTVYIGQTEIKIQIWDTGFVFDNF